MEQTQVDQRVQVKDSVCIKIMVAILAIYVENQIVLFKKEFLLIFESLVIIRINMMFLNAALVINHCKIIMKIFSKYFHNFFIIFSY